MKGCKWCGWCITSCSNESNLKRLSVNLQEDVFGCKDKYLGNISKLN